MATRTVATLHEHVQQFVLEGFSPQFDREAAHPQTNPVWTRLRELGTELWLDTGDMDDAAANWTREFTALTTNNTLLNKEVQKGQYDELIASSARMLKDFGLDDHEIILEIAFILNARHALKLVERFDAYVSVEEHTDLANDLPAAVEYARRYHAICPQRFIVKIPFTPAGLLATRVLSMDGIPVNHTLGFSARQNYVIARVSRPQFVNVFLGRLNSFVADNGLGSGELVGEKATLASQAAVRGLREAHGTPSRQIGASFRSGVQVRDLVGIDVMTMPPKVSRQFLDMKLRPDQIADMVDEPYQPPLNSDVDPISLRIDSLWQVNDDLVACVDDLEQENLDTFTPQDLVAFFHDHGCGDFMVDWTDQQIATSKAEGKIPKLDNWREQLASGNIALDSLMNLAGLNSFIGDQKAMDERVRDVLRKNNLA